MLEGYCCYSLRWPSRLKEHSDIGVTIAAALHVAQQSTKLHQISIPLVPYALLIVIIFSNALIFFLVYFKTWDLKASGSQDNLMGYTISIG